MSTLMIEQILLSIVIYILLKFIYETGLFIFARIQNRSAFEHATKHTVVITGASDGIGRAIALCLGRKKATLLLIGRNRSRLNDTAMEVQKLGGLASILICDLSQENDFLEILKSYKISFLINNAGICTSGPTPAINDSLVSDIYKINLLNNIALTQAVISLFYQKTEETVIGDRYKAHLRRQNPQKHMYADFHEKSRFDGDLEKNRSIVADLRINTDFEKNKKDNEINFTSIESEGTVEDGNSFTSTGLDGTFNVNFSHNSQESPSEEDQKIFEKMANRNLTKNSEQPSKMSQIDLAQQNYANLKKNRKEYCDNRKEGKDRLYILNIGSMTGDHPVPYLASYGSSKAALRAYVENVAHEKMPRVVIELCNTGFVCTKMSKIRHPSLFCPTSDDFAESLLRSFGTGGVFYAYYPHMIQNFLLLLFPKKIVGWSMRIRQKILLAKIKKKMKI